MAALMLIGLLLRCAVPVSAGVVRLPLKHVTKETSSATEEMQSMLATANGLSGGAQQVALNSQRGLAYFAEVQVGTPGQSMQLILDTGSANLWVPVEKRNLRGRQHSFYDPIKSSTHTSTDQPFSIEYGSGDVKGFDCRDTVALGGLVLPNFTLACVHDTTGLQGFDSAKFDGILGLGFQENAVGDAPTVMEVLFESGQLDEPTFGFYLQHGKPGEFIIGGVDAADVIGNFHFVEVSRSFPQPGNWVVDMTSVKVGEELTLASSRHAIVDSGTSYLLGPIREVQAIAAMLGASPANHGMYEVRCDAMTSSMAFTIGGRDLALEAEDLIVERMSTSQGDMCLLGLRILEYPYWILGDVFLRAFYVQFDWGRKRLGFAQSAASASSVRKRVEGTNKTGLA